MSGFPWHRIFHPLCGADPVTLLRLVARHGPPSVRGTPAYLVALATSLVRLPFTAADLALEALDPTAIAPPVFIVGYPRSGTTHLHNLLAASGAFATAPPVLAAMPWEARSLAPLAKPFIDPYLPSTRLIDKVAMGPEAPTEDEVGLANLGPGSYFHAVYFPRRFSQTYHEGLAGPTDEARRRAIHRYVAALGRRARERPLLLKNPAYTAQVDLLLDLFPGARIVHIHRDPRGVFASSRRALRRTMRELALQDVPVGEIDSAVLATYPPVMRALREQSAQLPPGRFAEVSFESLTTEPRRVLQQLWRQLDLPAPPGAMDRIDAHLRQVAEFRPEGARLEATDLGRLEAAWSKELALYGVPSAAGTG
ncbi:sulfotransferase family protein [Rubellimicrobium roseum]|uniref:Sulfotransferase n=1 Tax=Rubellimicrobium roseum TaxID=687525 RepID=A0A5C4NMU7_9RHOB|nr:sulfotransferase [Rubellimicrobium roseum]TNC74768.1 sulfotransferase [Rubellimicrobium roseum]